MQFMTSPARLRCAALMAITGGAVSQTMSIWGGDLARFLPPMLVMICAGAAGAGLAGLLLADGFGRKGAFGMLWSVLAWPIATACGAVFGAATLAIEWMRSPVQMVAHALEHGAPLGVMAVADGIATSPAVAGVWLVSGVAMHYGARIERAVIT
ncbi:hypothetical protein [uncultured Tateyamaria sp.]|uniref:hypothetical protein n=1 Tax=uncultured Tateyamaria sp. TaxID=455651 RepID=UPI002636EEE8|nr:hypothetical protein [uncultured Tateyamaria sp.]